MMHNVLWTTVSELPSGLEVAADHEPQRLKVEQVPKKIRSLRGISFGYWRDRKGGYSAMTLIPKVHSILEAKRFTFQHAAGGCGTLMIDNVKHNFWKCLCDDLKHRIILCPWYEQPELKQQRPQDP